MNVGYFVISKSASSVQQPDTEVLISLPNTGFWFHGSSICYCLAVHGRKFMNMTCVSLNIYQAWVRFLKASVCKSEIWFSQKASWVDCKTERYFSHSLTNGKLPLITWFSSQQFIVVFWNCFDYFTSASLTG